MGKFNEYTQKATPEDADSLMIYDATSKANKLSPFSGIWDWIAGKLTNAVISNLQTNNKTVVGALNELNSKRFKANSYIYSDGSTKTVSVKWGDANSHMTSFLLIDNNRITSLYITGKLSGVTEISKKSEYAVPPVLDTSSETLKVTLGSWSTALLICLESVTIS